MTPTTSSDSPADWSWRTNPWLIAASVVLATFMEVLDTTVIMVALPHIAGSMSASMSESTWTLTSYLVANGIVVPMSAWLAMRFGRKRLIMSCTGLFVAGSMACGLAPNLATLVIARLFQGAGGGAMVPVAQAILLETFPPRQRGMAMALFGLVVVLAPIIGPTLGGWLTDHYSWRWAFYINLPVGLLSLFLMARYLEDPPWIRNARIQHFDRLGFGLLVIWVGALQLVLDKGEDEDWFASPWITRLTLVAIAGLIAFVVQELRAQQPVVDLKVFSDRNFTFGTLTAAIFFGTMFSAATMLPQFLQTLMGYTAELSGLAVSPRGLGVLCASPLVGYLLTFVDARKLIPFGLAVFGVSNYLLSRLNLQIAMGNIVLATVIQGFGMGFLFAPLMTLTVGTLKTEQMGQATSLYNLVRNVAGSIGISISTTYLLRDMQRHQALLVSHLTPYDPAYQHSLRALEQMLGRANPPGPHEQQAQALLYRLLLQQAATLSYVDLYRWLALAVVICLPSTLFMRRVVGRRSPQH